MSRNYDHISVLQLVMLRAMEERAKSEDEEYASYWREAIKHRWFHGEKFRREPWLMDLFAYSWQFIRCGHEDYDIALAQFFVPEKKP